MPKRDGQERDTKRAKAANWDDWDEDDEEPDEEEQRFPRMGFLDHLKELRDRLFRSVIALLIGVIICWNFVDPLWGVLQQPATAMLRVSQEASLSLTKKAQHLDITLPPLPALPANLRAVPPAHDYHSALNDWVTEAAAAIEKQLSELLVARDSKLMQTSVTEAFFLKVKISFMAAIVLVYPFIMFQVWAFVAPGLYRRERKIALPFIVFATLFFLGGVAFGYYVAVPFAGSFLMAFGAEFVQMITIDKYMDFLITMMLGLGVVFEIPMVIFLLSKMGIATPRWLLKNFRYALLVIVIIAAIITPTGDPVNLAIFSIPMAFLYLLGVLIAAIWGPKRKKDEEEDEEDEEEEPDGEPYEEEEDDDEDDGDDADDEESEPREYYFLKVKGQEETGPPAEAPPAQTGETPEKPTAAEPESDPEPETDPEDDRDELDKIG